jgi:hypothetical protein
MTTEERECIAALRRLLAAHHERKLAIMDADLAMAQLDGAKPEPPFTPATPDQEAAVSNLEKSIQSAGDNLEQLTLEGARELAVVKMKRDLACEALERLIQVVANIAPGAEGLEEAKALLDAAR